MEALRIRKHIDSDTLHITGLQGVANKDVEVIILIDSDGEGARVPLTTDLPARAPGSAKGLLELADDFQAPLDGDAARDFYQ